MIIQISQWQAPRILLSSVLAILLFLGPALLTPGTAGAGVAWAGKLDGNKARKSGGNRSRPQKSKVDRNPGPRVPNRDQ